MLKGNNTNSKSTTSFPSSSSDNHNTNFQSTPPNHMNHDNQPLIRTTEPSEVAEVPVHHQCNETLDTTKVNNNMNVNVHKEETNPSARSSSYSPSSSITTISPSSPLTIQVLSNKSGGGGAISEPTPSSSSVHNSTAAHHHHSPFSHHHSHTAHSETASPTIIDPYIPISSSKSHLYKPMIDVCLRNAALDLSKFTSPRFDYKIIKKLGGGIEGQVVSQ